MIELLLRLTDDRNSSTGLGTIGSAGGQRLGVPAFLLLSLICLATTLPLGFSRPRVAAVIVVAASLLSLTVVHVMTVAGVIAAVGTAYRLGVSSNRMLIAVLGLPFLLLALTEPADRDVRIFAVLMAALLPAATVAGIARRVGRETQDGDLTRQVLANSLLEHTVRGERTRIARELHDVVAHHISMIAVQAETARLTVPQMPAGGAAQLLAIGNSARSALTEMRRLLGVLRDDDVPTPEDERQPQPGLRQLDTLFDEVWNHSESGIRVILQGSPQTLDPGVELAVYRIVQESLTNTRRHAPGAAIDVEFHYTREALHLRIRDNGPGPSSAGSPGHGLLGIRERATAVGGQVWTGPATGGGFLVEARFPTQVSVA